MMACTHLVFGFIIGLIMQPFVGGNPYSFMALVLFGSLLPDIDEPKSRFGRKIKPLSYIFKFTFGHRTFFHSIYFILLVSGILWIIFGKFYAIALFIGYVSHLLIDGLTVSGVNLLYPIVDFKISGFVKTGSLMEYVVFFVLVFVAAIMIF